jgi:uncharacterized protein (DUF433 family)
MATEINASLEVHDSETGIDWSGCELIERVPGKVSGRPVVIGTRVMPDAIANSFALGDSMEEIHDGFPSLTIAQMKRLVEFAQNHRTHPAA